MKIYIAGKITGDRDYFEKFLAAESRLEHEGYVVINPARLPVGLKPMDCMHICFAMIEVADAVCLLPDWEDSLGASIEELYARSQGKELLHYDRPQRRRREERKHETHK